ncbi:MAG: hypothetical protein FWC89_01105 [Defluviitaleaceae bacterium]|nr:hypothetical protein [Defluviitaleaceae bacterium]
MDTITEQLLAIESEAQEAMNDITKENAHLAFKAQEELERRVANIENEGAEAIRRLVLETERHTAARIAYVQDEYRIKGEEFESEFMNGRKILRGKIFHDVLYGDSV